jgi:hypothetical protein
MKRFQGTRTGAKASHNKGKEFALFKLNQKVFLKKVG